MAYAPCCVSCWQSGAVFEFTMAMLGDSAGAQAIGANLTRVPPGKAAFPLHHHHANEEHFFILSGTGILRLGEETFEVKPQDYIVNLPGEADSAHQLVNTGARLQGSWGRSISGPDIAPAGRFHRTNRSLCIPPKTLPVTRLHHCIQ